MAAYCSVCFINHIINKRFVFSWLLCALIAAGNNNLLLM